MEISMNKSENDIYTLNGHITVFCGPHSSELKNDILHSDLYSKLLAKKHGSDREQQWTSYTNTLKNLAWAIHSRSFSRVEFRTTTFGKIIQQSLASALLIDERQALTDALIQLKQLPDSSSAVEAILNRLNANALTSVPVTAKTPLATSALFTIVRQDKTMITVQLSFETADAIDIGILDKATLCPIKDGKTNIRILICHLAELQYNPFRETVIQKLGRKIESELLHIQAPPAIS